MTLYWFKEFYLLDCNKRSFYKTYVFKKQMKLLKIEPKVDSVVETVYTKDTVNFLIKIIDKQGDLWVTLNPNEESPKRFLVNIFLFFIENEMIKVTRS